MANAMAARHVKRSKTMRKLVNQMRAFADVPWPARKYRIAPTFGDAVARELVVGQCSRKVGETKVRKRRLARKRTVDVVCGGQVIVKRGRLGKRRAFCESCQRRKRDRLRALRLEQRQRRFGTPAASVREERRSSRLFRLRRGQR